VAVSIDFIKHEPTLGQGVYTFGEAKTILRGISTPVSVRQIRYWMNSGLTPASHSVADEVPILSFDDLISLEIIRRFRDHNVTLQSVRKMEQLLRHRYPERTRPFAYKVFFTDGASVWMQDGGSGSSPLIEELIGKHHGHFVWRDAIRTFAKDIHFTGHDQHAASWALTPWVEIDPAVQFGSPVVRGTRIPVTTIAENLTAGSVKEVADWYGLSVKQVEGARDYVAAH
jgi:uncharacterized protein (DUF433 family)/DNA-binding transcriptional MerR regulator